MALTPEELREYWEHLSEKPNELKQSGTYAVFSAYPVGSFRDFQNRVNFSSGAIEAFKDKETITVGLLVADARQSDSRDYLLNYLDYFHRRSGNYFSFYVAGFTPEPFGFDFTKPFDPTDNLYKNLYLIEIDRKKYYFDAIEFEHFIVELEEELKIKYTFNPMLVLFEMKPGHWGEARRVVFELDNMDDHNVRRSAVFFSELLDITKEVTSLKDITRKQKNYAIKGSIIDRIIASLDIPLIGEVKNSIEDIRRYRIKNS